MQFNIELFDKVTDLIEGYFAIISKWTSTHQELIKLVFGILVLLYNPRLSCTILLINCTKGTSLPLLITSLEELSKAYSNTKKAIKEHGPTLTGQLQKVAELTKELREVEKSINTITDGVPTATLEKIKVDIETLATVSQEGIETGKKIRSQLDYTTLYKVLGNLYLLTLTAVASARNSTATSLSIGLSLGNSITSNLKNLIKKYEDKIYAEAKKLDEKLESSSDINQRIAGALFNPESLIGNLNAAATFIGTSIGMTLSFYYTSFGRLLAAATLGSEIIVSVLQILIDPTLESLGLPTVKTYAVIIRSSLTYASILFNSYALIHGYGWIANFLLSPLLVIEVAACKIVADSVKF